MYKSGVRLLADGLQDFNNKGGQHEKSVEYLSES